MEGSMHSKPGELAELDLAPGEPASMPKERILAGILKSPTAVVPAVETGLGGIP